MASLSAADCVWVIAGDDAIVERSAFALGLLSACTRLALGLSKGDITISNRVNDSAAARYAVAPERARNSAAFRAAR